MISFFDCSCSLCNIEFDSKRPYDGHMREMHPKFHSPFACSKCPKRFPSLSKLQRHEIVHLPDELKLIHPCQFCDKRFSKLVNAQAHIRAIHTGDRPFICEEVIASSPFDILSRFNFLFSFTPIVWKEFCYQRRIERAPNNAQWSFSISMWTLSKEIQKYGTITYAWRHPQAYRIYLSTLWSPAEHKTNIENAYGSAQHRKKIQMPILWQWI